MISFQESPKRYHKNLIPQIIEKHAQKTPLAHAVSCNGEILTYRCLNEKSNQLAFLLKLEGIGNRHFIGIFIERSLDLIISVLAVLKTGAAYVPINTEYPKKRIEHIIQNINPIALITKEYLSKILPLTESKIIFLDKSTEIISNFPKVNLNNHIEKSNLAYLIHTSGSTGEPKGVMVSHNNLLYTYKSWKRVYNLKNTDVHLQMANFSFDVFTGDFVRALCSGAKLVLCQKNTLLRPEKLYSLMINEKITLAEFVPIILRKLVDYCKAKEFSLFFMRLLICGSDSLPITEYKKLQAFFGKNTRIINSYGITEATIDSTFFEEKQIKSAISPHAVLIGKPFPHAEIFILDENLNPKPYGEIGEIYIGGYGVSKGYFNQPLLTKQRFIPHPFSQDKETKLYKTGDEGRYLPDGNIEFIGRIDNQVKLKGFRIELGEIENAINSLPFIKESTVITYKSEKGYNKLAAYIITKFDKKINVQEMRNSLNKTLPAYMIPSIFIQLEQLPLNFNGKLDRQFLRNILQSSSLKSKSRHSFKFSSDIGLVSTKVAPISSKNSISV